MAITASELRRNVYRLLDEVLDTGEPLEIRRNGRTLRIVVEGHRPKLSRLVAHPGAVTGDPEDMVGSAWDEAAWAQRWSG